MSPEALNSLFSLCIGFALACGFWAATGGGGADDFRSRAVPGFCRALHHHAQHIARCEDRAPSLPIRYDGDHPGGVLEPDVRDVFRDDAARRRSAGLNGTAMPRFSANRRSMTHGDL